MININFEKPNCYHYFGIYDDTPQKFFWYKMNSSTKTYWKFGLEETNIRTSSELIDNVKKNRELNSEMYYYLVIHKKDLVFWLGHDTDGYTYENIKQYHKGNFNKYYIVENIEYVKDVFGKSRSCLGGLFGFLVFAGVLVGGFWLMAQGSSNFGFIGFMIAALISVMLIGMLSGR